MKRVKGLLICLVIAALLLTVVLSGCNLERKLQGVELKFNQKLASSSAYSFDVHLSIRSDGSESEIDLGCFKKNNEYAYSFYAPESRSVEYRRLFADSKLYEFASQTTLHTGTYSVQDNVAYNDASNLLYSLTQKIMLASYATLLSAGEKDKVGGKDVYRYDFTYQGNQYSLWYDDENMVKIKAVFYSTDYEGNVTSETYIAEFSNYTFGSASADAFKRPSEMGILYTESPIAIEDWMTIISGFTARANNWM